MKLYTTDVLAALPSSAQAGPVAQLCRKDPDSDAPAAAALIEDWVDRYNPPANVRGHLIGANADNFWAAYGELQVAASLEQLHFAVDMRASISRATGEPLTPDLIARKPGHPDLIVEVFTKSNDKRTKDQEQLLERISADLQRRLHLTGHGFLSLTVLNFGGDIPAPDAQTLDDAASEINDWLRTASYGDHFERQGEFPLSGTLMRGDRPEVALTPLGGALNQGWRIGSTLLAKINRYAGCATVDTRLTVAVLARGWKVTENQLVEAMLGGEVLTVDRRTGEGVELHHSGRGTAVPGSDFDMGNAVALSGAWYVEQAGFYREDPPGLPVHVAFVHSPYAAHPVTSAHIGAGRQYIVEGRAMRWKGTYGDASLMLQ